jgi:hypothetical protein
MTYLKFDNARMRYTFRAETTFTGQECTQNFEACCKPFCLVTRRGFIAKSKARRLPLEQVFKRKRRCLLNGNEKSSLLEEEKGESIASYRTALRPSQWRLRLIVTRHKTPFYVGWKAYTQQQGSAIFVRPSFCSLPMFHLVIILKRILNELVYRT